MIDLKHTDITGRTGHSFERYIGTTFQHRKIGAYYTIKKVVYLGELDLWGFEYEEQGIAKPIQHIRSHINFFGNIAGRADTRFAAVPDC